MTAFSSKNRSEIIDALEGQSFDLIVIGGGITGAGIALDATARGLKVLLLEMQDFAAGTSSRSTKLIHGGLRYLKQLEFGLVAEVGKEREIIHRNAPHLTKPEPMLLPITKTGSFGKWSTRLGMLMYEWLAGVKKEESHLVLSAAETLEREPLLEKNGLTGAILFYEYRTDDARLCLEILKKAVEKGAVALNYFKVKGFLYQGDKIVGLSATDVLSGTVHEIKADCVINASGPWVDELDALDNAMQGNKLQITKGSHLVVDHKKLPVRQSIYFDTSDKRMMFIIPREGKTYIGTTDTFYDGDKVNPVMSAGDKTYILKGINDYFPGLKLQVSDVESGWVGLRPLIRKPGKKPSEISRKDETFVWPSGLVTIAGGKLTGYRKMAERVLNKVSEQLLKTHNRKLPPCSTEQITVSGGDLMGQTSFEAFFRLKTKEGIALGLTQVNAEKLVSRYGSNVDRLFRLVERLSDNDESRMLLPLPMQAQLVYAIEHEMCVTPTDFFVRRTGMLYFDLAAVKALKETLLHDMQILLGWSEAQKKHYGEQLSSEISRAV